MAAVLLCLMAPAFARKKQENSAFDYAHRLGVAEITPQGQACVTVKDKKLRPGDEVSVVDSNTRTVIEGQVAQKLDKSCSRDPNAQRDDVFYLVNLIKNKLDPGTVAFAVINYTGPFTLRDDYFGFNTLRLEGQPDFFRICTSSEGLHLFVWNGLPGKGTLEWHRYHWLGYDVEPTCTEQDFSGIGKK